MNAFTAVKKRKVLIILFLDNGAVITVRTILWQRVLIAINLKELNLLSYGTQKRIILNGLNIGAIALINGEQLSDRHLAIWLNLFIKLRFALKHFPIVLCSDCR